MTTILPFPKIEQPVTEQHENVPDFGIWLQKFDELKNYWSAQKASFLEKREDRDVYDIEEEGVAIGAEIAVLRTFQEFLMKNFIEKHIPLVEVGADDFKAMEGGERLLQHLHAAGYDFKKLMKYWCGKYNKYRTNWSNSVFGEAQLFLNVVSDEKAKAKIEKELFGLMARMKMVYKMDINNVDEATRAIAMKERELLLGAVDDFLEDLMEYCRANLQSASSRRHAG
ncbi:hypothetical protein HY932_03670 [Candidatus Falkowbacteria bacterium]|nr:hypothetical protein [Candidatus Falkowbacteria bacterium]